MPAAKTPSAGKRTNTITTIRKNGAETKLDSLTANATLRLSFLPVEAAGTEVKYALTDTTRPVIFSYPGSAKGHAVYDILSMHYQDTDGNLNQWGMSTTNFQGHGIPALFDEWAHPACYTYATLQEDPNIREFWGMSLDKMWSGLFDATGGLGGAIWGYIDETFMLPEPKKGTAFWKEFAHTAKPEGYQGKCVGYGEWGIVDVWRREKPEFWSTKKAYSPVRLMQTEIKNPLAGECLFLTLYNRLRYPQRHVSAHFV